LALRGSPEWAPLRLPESTPSPSRPPSPGQIPASTCCQESFLLNPGSTLSRRIDLVLVRGDFAVLGIDVVGGESSDRTPSGLWPSDHAGVVATLRLPDPDDVVR